MYIVVVLLKLRLYYPGSRNARIIVQDYSVHFGDNLYII